MSGGGNVHPTGGPAGRAASSAAEAALRRREARQGYLLTLSDALGTLADPREIQRVAVRLLGERLGASRVSFGLVERGIDDEDDLVCEGSYCRDLPAWPARLRLSALGPARSARICSGPCVVSDVAAERTAADEADAKGRGWAGGVGAWASVPLVKAGRVVAILVVEQAEARRFTEDDLALVQETAERVLSALGRARAEAALQESQAHQAFLLTRSDRLSGLADPIEIQREACCRLGGHLGVNRVIYSVVEGDEQVALPGYVSGVAPLPEQRRRITPAMKLLCEGTCQGGAIVVEDVAAPPRKPAALLAQHRRFEIAAFVSVAMNRGGRWVGTFEVHSAQPRRWTPRDVELVRAVGDRVWHAVERAQAEGRLRRSEQRYRSLFQSIQQGFLVGEVVRDAAGAAIDLRPLEVNPAFERLAARDEGRGGGLATERRVIAETTWITKVAEAVETGKAVRFEHRSAFLGRWIEAHVWPLGGDAYASLITDMTARKEAEAAQARAHEADIRLREALAEANRAKDEFLAMLGHELRNPLTPILATLELMRLRGKRTFAAERDVIERQARHLARLVDDLLDVTRIARGKVRLVRARVDVADLVTRAIETASPALEERHHHLTTRIERGLAIDGDVDRLVQVLSNLISNAAKYTDPRGHIDVSATREGSEIVIGVRDDGCGIEAKLLPHIFDLFRQRAQGSARAQGGLGLGLAIARNLVELHGGKIDAQSDGAGRGSAFIVRLPAARPGRAARPTGRGARTEAAISKNVRRILIVDDNRDITTILAQLLRHQGHTVEVANSAVASLQIARAFRPEVALLDIGLPEMDGYELARRLKADRALRTIDLIAVTGYGQAADRAAALAAGFREHVKKPIDFERLLALIESPSPRARRAAGSRPKTPRRRGTNRAAAAAKRRSR